MFLVLLGHPPGDHRAIPVGELGDVAARHRLRHLSLPESTLGAAVGLSRETVNAALATLREAGAGAVARARVTITDRHALARIGRR